MRGWLWNGSWSTSLFSWRHFSLWWWTWQKRYGNQQNFFKHYQIFSWCQKLMLMYSRVNDSRAVLYWPQTGYKISGCLDSFVSLKFEIGKGMNSVFIISTSRTVFFQCIFNYDWISSLWEGDMEFALFFCVVWLSLKN